MLKVTMLALFQLKCCGGLGPDDYMNSTWQTANPTVSPFTCLSTITPDEPLCCFTLAIWMGDCQFSTYLTVCGGQVGHWRHSFT